MITAVIKITYGFRDLFTTIRPTSQEDVVSLIGWIARLSEERIEELLRAGWVLEIDLEDFDDLCRKNLLELQMPVTFPSVTIALNLLRDLAIQGEIISAKRRNMIDTTGNGLLKSQFTRMKLYMDDLKVLPGVVNIQCPN